MAEPFCPLIQLAQRIGSEADEHWAVTLMRISQVHPGLLPEGTFCDKEGAIIGRRDVALSVIRLFDIHAEAESRHRAWYATQATWVSQEGALILRRALGLLEPPGPDWVSPVRSLIGASSPPDSTIVEVVLNECSALLSRDLGEEKYSIHVPPRRLMWKQDEERERERHAGLHTDIDPAESRSIGQGDVGQITALSLDQAAAAPEPIAAAQGLGNSIPKGYSRKHFERVSRWRQRHDQLLANDEKMTSLDAAGKVGDMEVPPVIAETVDRNIRRLKTALKDAPTIPNGDQE